MQKIIIASGPVIMRDNRVLLDMHGEDNFWKFCGGKVNEDINLEQAAIKRAKEELGIDVEILNKEPFLFYNKKEKDGERTDILVAHYHATFTGEINPGKEIDTWQWHDINNLPENLAPSVLPALKYFGFIK